MPENTPCLSDTAMDTLRAQIKLELLDRLTQMCIRFDGTSVVCLHCGSKVDWPPSAHTMHHGIRHDDSCRFLKALRLLETANEHYDAGAPTDEESH